MGNTYIVYTEALLDDKWRCIDGYYMHKPYGKDKEELRLFSTYENGSRSYFGETYTELEHIGKRALFTELSQEIQECYKELKYVSNWCGEDTDEISTVVVVPYKTFDGHVPKGYSRHAIIHKDLIAAFESGDREEIWQDDEIDFNKLSDIEKQCYQYYEWDDPYGWEYNFKHLKKYVDHTINKYCNNEWLLDDPEIRLVVFCL